MQRLRVSALTLPLSLVGRHACLQLSPSSDFGRQLGACNKRICQGRLGGIGGLVPQGILCFCAPHVAAFQNLSMGELRSGLSVGSHCADPVPALNLPVKIICDGWAVAQSWTMSIH